MLDDAAGVVPDVAAGSAVVAVVAGRAVVPPEAGTDVAGAGVERALVAAVDAAIEGAVATEVAAAAAAVLLLAGCAWPTGAGGGESSTCVSAPRCR